jgi:hypothetical protein
MIEGFLKTEIQKSLNLINHSSNIYYFDDERLFSKNKNPKIFKSNQS